ncbi:MAG: acyltransferase family protein [Acetobacter sp.]
MSGSVLKFPRSHPDSNQRRGWRADIDGLRAIAVLSVVFYHVFPALVPGGFVGVDAFFVISGFLITGHLFDHYNKGRTSLLDFYLRRICRLLPALLCVLSGTLILGFFTLLPVEFAGLGKDVSAASLFVPNVLLWHEQGYFDRAAALKPLLHLWSLGVEEQFYLIWPLVLMGICWLRARRMWVFTGVFVLSFLLSYFFSFTDPEAGFYLPFSRLWEFLLGGGVAFLQNDNFSRSGKKLSPQWRTMLSIGGALAFVLALTGLRPGQFFPGPFALLPAGATAMLLAAGMDGVVNRGLLSRRPLRRIGLSSYPVYLWHWPFISWHHIVYGLGNLGNRAGLFLIGVSLMLGWLTSEIVERPFRIQRHRAQKALGLLLALSILCGAGFVVWQRQGWPERFGSATAGINVGRINLAVKQGIFSRTPHMKVRKENGITIATIGNAGSTVMLTGDSLAFQWGPRVERLFVEGHLKHTVVFVSGPACSPFLKKDYSSQFEFCKAMPDIQRQVIQKYHVETIIAGAAWPSVVLQHLRDQDSFIKEISEQIRGFSVLGVKKIWLILPTPIDTRFDPARFVQRSLWRTSVNEEAIRSGVSVEELRRSSEDMRRMLRAIAQQAGAGVIDPYPDICGSTPLCSVLDADGEPKYADMSHLRPNFVRNNIHFLDFILTGGEDNIYRK